jgi:nitrite reductase/ring-hydroxylating ferredoxin subunit
MQPYRFPFPAYPTGWYRVAWSEQLPPGQVLPLRFFGRELVLFRTESGVASMLDAHCPHLGAHLGHGGTVVGESIRCPFHAWEFGSNGQCTAVPLPGRTQPLRVGLKCWEMRELNGMVATWFDASGAPPSWEPAPWPEYNAPDWTPFSHAFTLDIRTHVQEVGENSADIQHFVHLHAHYTADLTSTELVTDGHKLIHTTRAKYKVFGVLKMLGKPPEGPLSLTFEGLGIVQTRAAIDARKPLRYMAVFCVTPLDEQQVRMSVLFSMNKSLPAPFRPLLRWKALRESRRSVDQDIPIWENKVYRERPTLRPNDGPIGTYREWTRQFYPSSGRPLPVVDDLAPSLSA